MGTHSTQIDRRKARVRRALKARASGRLRLSVSRSSKHIYAQIIDDYAGHTVSTNRILVSTNHIPVSTNGDVVFW